MTRNTEGGQPGGQYGGQYGYDQQQSYGNYSGEQGYNQQGGGYGGANQGNATSYYGSNEQAYQQYPPQGNYQGAPGPSYPPQQHYGGQGYDQQNSYQQPYGGPPPPQQYGQQYPPPQHYQQQQFQGGEVDAFRSQFDNQYAPPNAQGYYGQPPPAAHYPPPGAHPAGGPEQDRGLMGALGGAALGGFGGHKMGHGVLGTIGGAVAGSMAQDAFKKQKKEKKHKKASSRRGSHSSSSSSSSSSSDSDSSHGKKKHRGVVAGNFHASSNDIRLERGSVLVASCRDGNGHMHHSELDLNECLTNTNGRLGWARGGNFAPSSRNIRLADRGRVLEADLGDGRGSWVPNEIVLSERIGNENGRLHMM